MPRGNPKGVGRPTGASNLMSRPLKEWLTDFFNRPEEYKRFEADWSTLEPKDRLTLRAKLYEFIIPKPAAQASDTSDTSKSYTVVWS